MNDKQLVARKAATYVQDGMLVALSVVRFDMRKGYGFRRACPFRVERPTARPELNANRGQRISILKIGKHGYIRIVGRKILLIELWPEPNARTSATAKTSPKCPSG